LIGADESFVFMDAFCPSGAQVARQYFIERMDGWMDGWMDGDPRVSFGLSASDKIPN
jgi:hypothetical protein